MSDRTPDSRTLRNDRRSQPSNRFTPTVISLEDRTVPADLGSLNPSLVVLDAGRGADPARAFVTGTLEGEGDGGGSPVEGGFVEEVESNEPAPGQDIGLPPMYTLFAQDLEAADWVVTDDGTVPFDEALGRALPHVTILGNASLESDNGTHDYYTLVVPEGGGQVWVNTNRFPLELQVFVFDESGTEFALTYGNFYDLPAGTYTLAVGAAQSSAPEGGLLNEDGAAAQGAYELYVAVDTHSFVEPGSGGGSGSGEGSNTYSIDLGSDEFTAFAATGADPNLRVEVLDANGNVVAGDGSSIASFAAPTAGTYTVRVSGTGDYGLLVGVNTPADAEVNDSRAEAQSVLSPRVHRHHWVTGSAGAGDTDFYRVEAPDRSRLTFSSVQPAGAEGDWVRPLIRVYNENGRLVASNANNRTRDLSYQVPRNQGGTFFVEVSAPNAAMAREYAVAIRGANSAAGSIAWEHLVGNALADLLDNNPSIEENLEQLFAWFGVNVD